MGGDHEVEPEAEEDLGELNSGSTEARTGFEPVYEALQASA